METRKRRCRSNGVASGCLKVRALTEVLLGHLLSAWNYHNRMEEKRNVLQAGPVRDLLFLSINLSIVQLPNLGELHILP